MHPDIQKTLMCEQKKIIYSLRQYHETTGTTSDAVTAIISTSIMGRQHDRQMKVGVVLVNGILTGTQSILDGDDEDGVIVNLAWLYSEELARKAKEECRRYRTFFLSVDPERLGDRPSTSSGLMSPQSSCAGRFGGAQVTPMCEREQQPTLKVNLMQKSGTYQFIPEVYVPWQAIQNLLH